MKDKKQQISYPSRYEIKETLSKFSSASFVKKFAQERGIFLTKATQPEIASFMSGLFFEHIDLEEIREGAYRNNIKETLSGFVISSENIIEPVSFIDSIMGSEKLPKGLELKRLIERTDKEIPTYEGKCEYSKNKPGRVQFLQKETKSFSYAIEQINDYTIRVLVNCNSSNDGRVLEDVFKKHIKREDKFFTILADKLSSAQTIEFFDKLAKEGLNSDWRFLEITHLVLKEKINDLDDLEESVEIEDKEKLSGITQAILKGKDLRDHKFVKDCEESGYCFSAMTYQFKSEKTPHYIEIKAEFKGRPKIFEIGINKVQAQKGIGLKLGATQMEKEDRLKIERQFRVKSEKIYSTIIGV